MYEKLEDGEIINVQGLECCIPPEGYVVNIITNELEYRGIYCRSEIPSEQFWYRFPFPEWYKKVLKEWDEYDKKKKDEDPEFYDERLEKYKAEQWDRRLNGFWFMNNGEAVYLTGTHYYFLQVWMLDTGIPDFRMPDLDKAYFMQYCIEDPLCMGLVEVTKRRFGKSFWAGLFITEYITRTKMTNGGIQSKTGKDAKKFFGKTIVSPFRRLPKFFRPVYDTSLGANPKSEIRFQRANVRGKKADENISDDELGSLIDHESADKVAYDGQKLHRYVADECGKTVEEDIYERHEVVRYCLLDDKGKIIGKALYTTTVEKIDSDKDGVQEAFKTLWNESDQNNRNELGMTGTGLYRFFMTAKKTRHIDKYGYPNEEKTEREILAERESVKGNTRALSARTRKEPITIQEAFSTDADKCIFNVQNIDNREQELKDKPVYKRKIVFEVTFDKENKRSVKWRDINKREKDFHWQITYGLTADFESNKYEWESSLRKPVRASEFVINVDSYGNNQGGRKYGSKASAWLGRKYDVRDPENTFKAIGNLYGRPQEKSKLHEQVMLCAEYFSCQAWYEFNSDDYDPYFGDRGKRLYLGIFPLSTIPPDKRASTERLRGFPTTPFSLTRQNDVTIAYFESYSHLIDWPELLDNAKKYDPYDRTKFDMVVSFEMLIVCLMEPVYVPPKPKNALVRTYPNTGVQNYN